jgi:hypothetical protein
VLPLRFQIEEGIESDDIIDPGEGYAGALCNLAEGFLGKVLVFIEELRLFENAEQLPVPAFVFRYKRINVL